MSNWKYVYGWSGHLLIPKSLENKRSREAGMTAINSYIFGMILADNNDCVLDPRIRVEKLGITTAEVNFLASGCHFSEGFEFYGTVFNEAERRCSSPGGLPTPKDAAYIAAMKEIYNLDLPPSRLMIGCASET